MLPRLYTVTDIAEEICRADDLRLGDHAIAHSQVRNAVRRGMLKDGKVIDKRGTLAFPPLEIYRARILNTLADLSIDLAKIEEPLESALANSGHLPVLPERCRFEGATLWRGLVDIVEGVRNGEEWTMALRLHRPGYVTQKRIIIEFDWSENRRWWGEEPEGTAKNLATGAPQAVLTIDLVNLFAGLPGLDNV
jgi:hypothetical protein